MITVTILTKDCEETLGSTLESLKGFPEVLIYDTGSSDGTLDAARRFANVKVFQGSLTGFGPTHNRASALATHDWILSIDSDEVLSPALSEEILKLTLRDPCCVYEIERHNFFNGKWIRCCSGWYPDSVVRLYHRGKTCFSEDAVHEKILSSGLTVVPLSSPLLHTPYRSIEDFLRKMQLYATLFAKQHVGKKRSSLFIALVHGFSAFLKNYFIQRGIFGGKEGLILSLYNGHVTFYKYLMLNELNEKARPGKKVNR